MQKYVSNKPILVATPSKASVRGHSNVETAISNPVGDHGCLSGLWRVCCQAEFSVSGRSPVQRSPTESDREASLFRRPWHTSSGCARRKNP